VRKAPPDPAWWSVPPAAFGRGKGRLGHIPGKFAPAQDDAVALRDYIAQYLQTADGVVPYGRWPAGVKGRFGSGAAGEFYMGLPCGDLEC
jgi:hypothetical protein